MRLTSQQILFFRHTGFLKLPELPPEALVERLKQTTVENGCTLVLPGSHLLPWDGSHNGNDIRR